MEKIIRRMRDKTENKNTENNRKYTKQDFIERGYSAINYYHYDTLQQEIKKICDILIEDKSSIVSVEYNTGITYDELKILADFDESGNLKKVLTSMHSDNEFIKLYAIEIINDIMRFLEGIRSTIDEICKSGGTNYYEYIKHIENIKCDIKKEVVDIVDYYDYVDAKVDEALCYDGNDFISNHLEGYNYHGLLEIIRFTTKTDIFYRYKSGNLLFEFCKYYCQFRSLHKTECEDKIETYMCVINEIRNTVLKDEIRYKMYSFFNGRRKKNKFSIPFYFIEFYLNKGKINNHELFDKCYEVDEKGNLTFSMQEEHLYVILGEVENRPLSKIEIKTNNKFYSLFTLEKGNHILVELSSDNDDFCLIKDLDGFEAIITLNNHEYNILDEDDLRLMEIVNYGDIYISRKENDFDYRKASYADYLRGTFDKDFIINYRRHLDFYPAVPISATQIKNKNKK